MHVLVIPRDMYDVPRVPIQGVFESHQVAALTSAGMRVGVVSGGVITTRYLGRRFPYIRHQTDGGVPVYRAYRRAILPARLESPATAAKRTYSRVKPRLSEFFRDNGRPDVIHAHNLTAGGLLARLIQSDFDVPYVVTEHTSAYAAEVGAISRDFPALERAATSASAIIAVGTQLADNLRRGLGEAVSDRVFVVPNVVDPLLLAGSLVPRADPYTIAAIGNLSPRKNYDLLLRAFALADLPVNARLVIGGSGQELGRLHTLAQGLGLGERVEFQGQLSRDGVMGLMRRADLFAHPSDSESFGVVLIEAMSLGVPVLATASGGPQDIVTPDVGRLSAVGDVDGFADGLTSMYRRRLDFDPGLIRVACRTRFGPEAFAARMLAIYRKAVS